MTLLDSGDRREFETGAVRDMSAGKGRYDLIPYEELRRLALIYEKGVIKYGEKNWQKGLPIASLIDSAIRHLQKFAADIKDEDHGAQAVWNIFTAMWTLEQIQSGKLPAELDDRPYKVETISIPTCWTTPAVPTGADYPLIITNADKLITWTFSDGQWRPKGD